MNTKLQQGNNVWLCIKAIDDFLSQYNSSRWTSSNGWLWLAAHQSPSFYLQFQTQTLPLPIPPPPPPPPDPLAGLTLFFIMDSLHSLYQQSSFQSLLVQGTTCKTVQNFKSSHPAPLIQVMQVWIKWIRTCSGLCYQHKIISPQTAWFEMLVHDNYGDNGFCHPPTGGGRIPQIQHSRNWTV